MIEQARRKYRNLGVTEGPGKERLLHHAFKTVMGAMEVIRHGAGEFVYPVCLNHHQERNLAYRLYAHHGLKDRLMTVRGVPIEGDKEGTLFLIEEKGSKRLNGRGERN